MNEWNQEHGMQEENQTPDTPEQSKAPESAENGPAGGAAGGSGAGAPTPPMFSWDGKQPRRGRGSRKAAVFCAVAALCLLLTAAICIPTILYTLSAPVGTNSDPSASHASLPVGDGSHYDISQTVQVSGNNQPQSSELTQLYETCSPSCVTIYVTYGRNTNGYAIGSGFVLTADGYIATNQHVIEDGANFKVIFYDGTEYDAELVGSDAIRDLAVLKINAKELKPLEIGNSSALAIGQFVIAIGTPYDIALAGTMTYGIISGVNREIEITDDNGRVTKTMTLIQTDTAINPGNSGGPLLNTAGQVIGINSLKLADDYEGIGFAIPINYAVEIFNQLIQYGRVVQDPSDDFVTANARLGVTVYNLEAGLQAHRIRPQCEYPDEGVLVVTIEPNTAAYAAGLQMYHIITEFAGEKITNVEDLTNVLAKHKAGETVTMKVFAFSRNFSSGEYQTLTFVLDAAA